MLSPPNCAPTRRMFDMPAKACMWQVVSTSYSGQIGWTYHEAVSDRRDRSEKNWFGDIGRVIHPQPEERARATRCVSEKAMYGPLDVDDEVLEQRQAQCPIKTFSIRDTLLAPTAPASISIAIVIPAMDMLTLDAGRRRFCLYIKIHNEIEARMAKTPKSSDSAANPRSWWQRCELELHRGLHAR